MTCDVSQFGTMALIPRKMTEKANKTRIISDPFELIDTSECGKQDHHQMKIRMDLDWWNALLEWEGGIAFIFVFCIVLFILIIIFFRILRHIFSWEFLHRRFIGSSETTSDVKSLSWADWFTLAIDENAVGKDGATYLWFQYRLIQVYTWMMVFGVVLITMHDIEVAADSILSYATLNDVGLNGVHSILSLSVVVTLAFVMSRHGIHRQIRTLASPLMPNMASGRNRQWLMISGIRPDVTVDSLCKYLKEKFNAKRISPEEIVFANDLTELWPILEQLNAIRDIKRQLVSLPSGPELIQRRFWNKNTGEEDTMAYYNRKEKILLSEKDIITKNLKFIGTAFIRFDDPVEAKATKKAIINHQSKQFCYSSLLQTEEDYFRLRQWTVRYAPPGSDINWQQLEGQHSIWKKLSVLFMLLIAYSTYITVMAAPGFIVRSLDLEGDGSHPIALTWKSFVLPNIVTFITAELTGWVTNLDRFRHHLCLADLEIGKLRSIFYLSTILYFVRMVAVQPLPLLFSGQFDIRGLRLVCLYLPDHGDFIASAIIVNTASRMLIDHSRLEYLLAYVKKRFTFRSEAEHTAWKKSYILEYDFASRYAGLTKNFVLTCILIITFPVIGFVSWISSVLSFWSDRHAMMKIHAVSSTSPSVHQEAVNIVLSLSILSPLALLVYRIAQIGLEPHDHLLDALFVGPLCITVLCAIHLIYAYLQYFPKWTRLRRWAGHVEDDEEDTIDVMINTQYQYDIIKGPNSRIHQSI